MVEKSRKEWYLIITKMQVQSERESHSDAVYVVFFLGLL